MTESVEACPACDTTSGIYKRHATKVRGRNKDSNAMWVCRECGAEFDTPNTRPANGSTNTQKGLAGRLANANPEEVGP